MRIFIAIILFLFVFGCEESANIYSYRVYGVSDTAMVRFYDIYEGVYKDTIVYGDFFISSKSTGACKYHISSSDKTARLYFTVSSDCCFFIDRAMGELIGYYKFD